MNIFLTGSTGFIGSHLLNKLNKMEYHVTCLVRKEAAFKSKNITWIKEDLSSLCNRELACKLLSGHDTVIHCAAIRGEMRLPWSEYYKINVETTCALLEAAREVGITKFVYLSSVGVLGTTPLELPASEKTPYDPDCMYHKSKMLAEKHVLEYSRANGLISTVIRPSITYGPNDNGFLLKITGMAAGGYFPLINGGRNRIHLTYIDGLVEAIISSLSYNGAAEKIYTIVDAEPISFRDLIEIIATSLGQRVRYINIPSKTLFMLATKTYDTLIGPLKKSHSLTMSAKILALPWYYEDRYASDDLSYIPHDTRKQIPKTIQWLKNNGWIKT